MAITKIIYFLPQDVNADYTKHDHEWNCKHNNLDCNHHPTFWIEKQVADDVRRFTPVYYNTPLTFKGEFHFPDDSEED